MFLYFYSWLNLIYASIKFQKKSNRGTRYPTLPLAVWEKERVSKNHAQVTERKSPRRSGLGITKSQA